MQLSRRMVTLQTMLGTYRRITEPEKKLVAARQQWRCSDCNDVLPAAYQVDHTVPLCDGGLDAISNCTAMCPNCHARKTQLEHIARFRGPTVERTYEDREDSFNGNRVRCSLCLRTRNAHAAHNFCTAIERPHCIALTKALSRYQFRARYTPRGCQAQTSLT